MHNVSISGHELLVSDTIRDLGVILDNKLNMNAHISAVCRSSHYHLRNIAITRQYLSDSDAAKLIHALVTSRLDYCNAVMVGLPNSSISRPQRVLNNAARVLARVNRSEHITQILIHYHWLLV